MQINTQTEQAPVTSLDADMVKCNKKIQFNHTGIDNYPLMPHNSISNNILLLYAF